MQRIDSHYLVRVGLRRFLCQAQCLHREGKAGSKSRTADRPAQFRIAPQQRLENAILSLQIHCKNRGKTWPTVLDLKDRKLALNDWQRTKQQAATFTTIVKAANELSNGVNKLIGDSNISLWLLHFIKSTSLFRKQSDNEVLIETSCDTDSGSGEILICCDNALALYQKKLQLQFFKRATNE